MGSDFFRRASRVASRNAHRSNSDAGRDAAKRQASSARHARRHVERAPRLQDPLVELLLGGPLWRRAVMAQAGCFNPAYARQHCVN